MNKSYIFLLFIAYTQPALFMFFWGANISLQTKTIEIVRYMNNTFYAIETNHTPNCKLELQYVNRDWSPYVLWISVLCCIFATLHILMQNYSETNDDIFEVKEDSALLDTMCDDALWMILSSRVIFWSWVLWYVHLCIVSFTCEKYQIESKMYIMALERTGVLFLLCQTISTIKRNCLFIAFCIGSYVYVNSMIWWWGNDTEMNLAKALFICLQVALDILLYVGHFLDTKTTTMVLLNCRLFYVSVSVFALQIFISSHAVQNHGNKYCSLCKLHKEL